MAELPTERQPFRRNFEPFPIRLAQLLGLWCFAFWPLPEVWRAYPEFVAVHGVSRGQFVGLLLSLSVAPALVAAGLVSGLARWRMPFARALERGLVGLLVAMIAAPPLARSDGLPGLLPALLALALGAAASWLWTRSTVLRSLACASALAAPLPIVLCAVSTPLRHALRPAVAALPATVESGGRAPVVLVIFDELPLASLLDATLRIDATHFPNFARLAQMSTWYPRAMSVAHSTLPAVSALLTGLYPRPDAHATLASWPRNLFTLFWDSGPLHVMEPSTRLKPEFRDPRGVYHLGSGELGLFVRDSALVYVHTLTPPSWRDRWPPVDRNWIGFLDATEEHFDRDAPQARQEQEFQRWIEGLSEGASLSVAHTVLPHAPYRHFPSGQVYSQRGIEPSQAAGWAEWKGCAWAIAHSQQRHLLQLAYVDRLLGRVLDRLGQMEILDSTLLVVTADHGVAFQSDAHRRQLQERNASEVLGIPLFLKLPGQRQGAISQLPAESVDILPTIVDALDLPCDWAFDGVSLLTQAAAGRSHRTAVTRVLWELPLSVPDVLNVVVARNAARFPAGGEAWFYALGPFASLFGQPVHRLCGPASTRAIQLLQGSSDVLIEPELPLLAAELVGTIELYPGERGLDLAIAVDGVVQALTHTYLDVQGEPRPLWSALLPEASLSPGPHRLEFFEISALADSILQLRPLLPDRD